MPLPNDQYGHQGGALSFPLAEIDLYKAVDVLYVEERPRDISHVRGGAVGRIRQHNVGVADAGKH